MKKRGFTLIELLSILVVLAIIALIAVPLIVNVIEKARKAAFLDSAYGILKSAEYAHMNSLWGLGEVEDVFYTYENGVETPSNGYQLNYKGKRPLTGNISVKKDGTIKLALSDGTYCVQKDYFDNEIAIRDLDEGACEIVEHPPSLSIHGYEDVQEIEIFHEVGQPFTVPGATAIDYNNQDISEHIVVTNEVDIDVTGSYIVRYRVEDDLGNATLKIITVIVRSTVLPTIIFNPDGNDTYGKNQGTEVRVIDANGVDSDSLKYLWSTSTTVPSEASFTESFTNETVIEDTTATKTGDYYLWILAKNVHGGTTITRSNVFKFDNTKPNMSAVTVTATNFTNDGFTISRTGNASDAHSGLLPNPYTYYISTDGDNWSIAKLLTNDTTASVNGLSVGDTRYYRVCANDNLLNFECTTAQSATVVEIYEDPSGASAPELSTGMIPIIRNTENTEWLKADVNGDWYSYGNRRWANVALVTTGTRSTYQAAAPGTIVNETDVLGYLVWIPRYSYQLFNYDSAEISSRGISIQFESTSITRKNGWSDGSWHTHPAFRFGTEEINGFWVGKFMTTATPQLGIKPNQNPIVNQNVSTQFNTSRQFNSATYGLSAANDSHMMKNTEWGAVAYLSYSNYGYAGPIWSNPSINWTGCAGAVAKDVWASYCQHQYYTTNGVLTSTTRNVYGVYDMSGSKLERVMSYSTNYYVDNSGFNGNFPEAKYIDVYPHVVNTNVFISRKLGDATAETHGWNGNSYGVLTSPSSPWLYRGGSASNTSQAGLFAFQINDGSGTSDYGFRVVMLGR